jgi:hypothetical protein
MHVCIMYTCVHRKIVNACLHWTCMFLTKSTLRNGDGSIGDKCNGWVPRRSCLVGKELIPRKSLGVCIIWSCSHHNEGFRINSRRLCCSHFAEYHVCMCVCKVANRTQGFWRMHSAAFILQRIMCVCVCVACTLQFVHAVSHLWRSFKHVFMRVCVYVCLCFACPLQLVHALLPPLMPIQACVHACVCLCFACTLQFVYAVSHLWCPALWCCRGLPLPALGERGISSWFHTPFRN